ncbi:MAG: endonuclease/exonuclease/phosphatase family protein [Hydrogenophaga sp.]|nr:endonuclease/exonuclease/phosphatase family protein [Hydrogenophaga sp.]
MKIATYNINGVNGRLTRLTHWLATAEPDVVCLQEIKTASATFPHEAQGWTDAIAKKHPGKPMYTYWDYFRQGWQRNAGLRIDHLLLNAAAAARLKDAGIDREERGGEKPSDHAPAWITLKKLGRSG